MIKISVLNDSVIPVSVRDGENVDVAILTPVVGSAGTMDHTLLTNRDAPDQHPTSAITGLDAIIAQMLTAASIGANLEMGADGKINVLTASDALEDNTRPITSAAVYAEIGNINALLAGI